MSSPNPNVKPFFSFYEKEPPKEGFSTAFVWQVTPAPLYCRSLCFRRKWAWTAPASSITSSSHWDRPQIYTMHSFHRTTSIDAVEKYNKSTLRSTSHRLIPYSSLYRSSSTASFKFSAHKNWVECDGASWTLDSLHYVKIPHSTLVSINTVVRPLTHELKDFRVLRYSITS